MICESQGHGFFWMFKVAMSPIPITSLSKGTELIRPLSHGDVTKRRRESQGEGVTDHYDMAGDRPLRYDRSHKIFCFAHFLLSSLKRLALFVTLLLSLFSEHCRQHLVLFGLSDPVLTSNTT
jgi:hypothetical protein